MTTTKMTTYTVTKAVVCSVQYTIQLPAGLSEEEIQKAAQESEVPEGADFNYEEELEDSEAWVEGLT